MRRKTSLPRESKRAAETVREEREMGLFASLVAVSLRAVRVVLGLELDAVIDTQDGHSGLERHTHTHKERERERMTMTIILFFR